MGKALESFRKRLSSELAPHGAIGEFCKKAGVTRNTVRGWLEGAAPSLDLLEKAAEALGTTPWELIRPDEPASPKASPTLSDIMEELRKISKKLERV